MEHPALKNLYEQVINGLFQWERWGLLGVLSDYVLNYVQGDIMEIGCGESSIFLSQLAEKYNRKCYHIEYSKSGVENMKNTKGYFGKNSQVFNMKSEEFFKALHTADIGYPNLALGFIDGDHSYEVATYDFEEMEKYLVVGGYIFIHDTLPPTDEWTVPEKCGTVYKLREDLENESCLIKNNGGNIEVFTFPRSSFDVGLTMVRKID